MSNFVASTRRNKLSRAANNALATVVEAPSLYVTPQLSAPRADNTYGDVVDPSQFASPAAPNVPPFGGVRPQGGVSLLCVCVRARMKHCMLNWRFEI